jgi:hypothetical protein
VWGGGKLEGGEGWHEVDNSQHFARRQRFQGRQVLACAKFLPPAKFLACAKFLPSAKFFGAYIFEYFSAFLLSMCQQLDWRKCFKIFRLRLIIVVMIMYCVS